MPITKEDIIAQFRNRGRGDPPSALADISVNSLLRMTTYLDAKNTFARDEQSLVSILASLEDLTALGILSTDMNEDLGSLITKLQSDIDAIATNFGTTRQPASQSRGNVALLRNSALTEDINVPAGTKVFSTELEQEYQTTETVLITTMTFDSNVNAFVASVPIESANSGLDTIVAEGQINQLRSSIVGIDGVTNIEIVGGGRDRESDQQFVTRLLEILSANNIGTKAGYEELIFSQENVKGVSAIGANDPFMFRDLTDGGAVDIYVTDPLPISISETILAAQVEVVGQTFVVIPSRQPVINDVTTINPAAGFVIGINKDTGAFGGSQKANDQIVLDTDPTGLVLGYQSNKLVSDLQAFVELPENSIFGSDVLIRAASVALVDVIFSIRVLSGFTPSVVTQQVETEVTQAIANLNIGQSLEQSDIVEIAVGVPGVDRVNLPPTKFDRSTGTVQNVITAAANEVLRPNTVIANIA